MNSSYLNTNRSSEENNYQASIERLGNTASLIDDFIDAFESISSLICEKKDPPNYFNAVFLLFLATRCQFEKACLECLRGHLTFSYQIVRRAIEMSAFSARICRHPHFVNIWFEASKDEESYQLYREKFSPGKIFPNDDELLVKLNDRYEKSSKQMHASVISMCRGASIDVDRKCKKFNFTQCEIKENDKSEPAITFFFILDTFFGILLLFERIFNELLNKNIVVWEVRKNALEEKLFAHKKIWEKIITT